DRLLKCQPLAYERGAVPTLPIALKKLLNFTSSGLPSVRTPLQISNPLGAHAARVRVLWKDLFPWKKSSPQAPHAGRVRSQVQPILLWHIKSRALKQAGACARLRLLKRSAHYECPGAPHVSI